MDVASVWQGLGLRDKRNLYIALSAPLIGFTTAKLIKSLIYTRTGSNVIPSPRKSLQLLSAQDPDALPYPPDALPGARDVDTPYGNIRVYEWQVRWLIGTIVVSQMSWGLQLKFSRGPEEGRKVLFVHGISTPCIAFARMARLLVERGCRVMLFDLFGRGYSDAPDPALYRQDIGLWTSQILLVLSSSKLAWTGADGFSMVGYSMGGGISAAFTSYFPQLVESLILIAPGGLLRPSRISRSSKLLYGNLLPGFVVSYFVGRRLRDSSGPHPAVGGKAKSKSKSATAPAAAAESEIPGHPANAKDSDAAMIPGRPRMSVAKTVAWETDAHPGFLPSFISSIRYAPVSHEHERWRLIGNRCSARRASAEPDKTSGLDEDKVLIIFGAQDPVIVADEVEKDATAALGNENVTVIRLEGGHDVPIVNSRGCADAISEFWNDSPV